MFNPLPARQDILQSLEEDEFDILVIGGGATGTGVALDSVTRGRFLSISSAMNSLCIDLEIEYAYMFYMNDFHRCGLEIVWLVSVVLRLASLNYFQLLLYYGGGFGMFLSDERSDFSKLM